MKKLFSEYLNYYRGISISIWLNLLAVFINSGTSVIVLFLTLYLTRQFHFDTISVGWVMASFGIGATIGSLGSGFLCDRYQPQLISIITLIVNALTLLLIPFLHDYYSILSIVTLA